MKRFYILVITLIISAQTAFCTTDVVSEDLKHALKTTSHNEPGFFSILMSLLFVIGLIYVTGVIYSKLNIVGAKTVKEQLKQHELTNAIVLSTTQLGQGKNLHVIEIDGKRLLIGATPSAINLIKELDMIETEQLNTTKKPDTETEETKEIELEEFDLHKKYL